MISCRCIIIRISISQNSPLIFLLKLFLMELEYQSHRNVDIAKQLNRLDKLNSKLALTLRDLPSSQAIPQNFKDKVVTLVSNDRAKELLTFLDREVIAWNKEVGAKGTLWNVLHLCSKFNAVNCLRVLLKKIYRIDEQQYVVAVNAKTTEGFTLLMIAIIYKADKILELLLQLGGVDLSIIQKGKLRAYDLALHYRNQFAISQLIVYQDQCRKKPFTNQQQLGSPQPILQQKPSIFDEITNYLIDCFICFKNDQEQDEKEDKMFAKPCPLVKNQKAVPIDSVKVGSRRDIEDYQIQWKRLSTMKGQKIVLFNSFKPQDICENQFALKNSLILLQTLSDFPWLLRRVISKIDMPQVGPQKYCVALHQNGQYVKIEVDQCVPIVKERGQPMFLSDRNQTWPMILQKAMAKAYGSYLTLNTLSPTDALQSITGFYVKEMPLKEISQGNGIISILQQLSVRGYLVILQGRPRTDLNSGLQTNSYAILNLYEKGSSKKLLVSCPNIVQNWIDSKQNRQLAILKAHFSRHNQSCLWIDQSKLQYYFSHVVVAFVKEGYIRSDIKMKLKIKKDSQASVLSAKSVAKAEQYSKSIFFKIKIQHSHDQPVLMQLTDLETRKRFDLSKLQGWRNEGSEIMLKQEEYVGCSELIKFNCVQGEYLCKFDLRSDQPKDKEDQASRRIIKKRDGDEDTSEGKKKVKLNLGPEHLREIQLSTWGSQQLQLELFEESFGTIEWLAQFRNYASKNWRMLTDNGQEYLTETVNGKSIILTKRLKEGRVLLVFEKKVCGIEAVEQGKWVEHDSQVAIQMVKDEENRYVYCVLVGIPSIQDKKEVKVVYSL